jgi:hypothetical protein
LGSLVLGAIVAICLCIATAIGMWMRARLPDHHLNTDSKDVIRLATAVVGTLSALALGLLIASAKSAYDDAGVELKSSVAHVILLDRLMAHYGPETDEARALLRQIVVKRLERGWTVDNSDQASGTSAGEFQDIESVQAALRELKPQTDPQRLLQTRSLEVSGAVAEGHWLLIETENEGLPWAFLTVLVFWLGLLFATFGLQAPLNTTVVIILVVCAISVGGAVFLIVDMAQPYTGVIHVSDTPLRAALARLGNP